jgi:hypothetical protein
MAMKQRSDALPPVPLSDSDLQDVAHHADIVRVWVPIERPETVHTLAGEHAGDILEFWVETETRFVSYRYTAPDGAHLGWYRSDPTPKDHAKGAVVGETLTEDYRIFREGTP